MAAFQIRPILLTNTTSNKNSTKIALPENVEMTSSATNMPNLSNLPQLSSFIISGNNEPTTTVLLTRTAGIGAILIPTAAAQGKNLVPILPKVTIPAQHPGKQRLSPLKKAQTRRHMSIGAPFEVQSQLPCTSSINTSSKKSSITTTAASSRNRPRISRPSRAAKKATNEMRFILPKTSSVNTNFTAFVSPLPNSVNGMISKSEKANLLLDTKFYANPAVDKNLVTSSSLSRFPASSDTNYFPSNNTEYYRNFASNQIQNVNIIPTSKSSVEANEENVLPSVSISQRLNFDLCSSRNISTNGKGNLQVHSLKNASSNCTSVPSLSAVPEKEGDSKFKENAMNPSIKSISVDKCTNLKNFNEFPVKKKVILIKSVTEERTSLAIGNHVSSVFTVSRNTDKSAFTLCASALPETPVSSSDVRTFTASIATEARNNIRPVSTSINSEANENKNTFKVLDNSSLKVSKIVSTSAHLGENRPSVTTPMATCNLKPLRFENDSSRRSRDSDKVSYKSTKNFNLDCNDLSMCGIEVDEPPHDHIVNPLNYQKASKYSGVNYESSATMITRSKTIVINSNDISSAPEVNIYPTNKAVGGVHSALVPKKHLSQDFFDSVDNGHETTDVRFRSSSDFMNGRKENQQLMGSVDKDRKKSQERTGSYFESEKILEEQLLSRHPPKDGSSSDKDGLVMTHTRAVTGLPPDQPNETQQQQDGHIPRMVHAKADPAPKKIVTKGQTMLCQVCGKLLSSPSSLRTHLLTHSSSKPYACNACPRRFRRRVYLRHHMLTHTDERPYVCTSCSAAFKTQHRLTLHSRRHALGSETQGYYCHLCARVFQTKRGLNSHSKQHASKTPCSCEVCGKAFKSLTSLKLHNQAHKKPERLQHKCEICGQMYVYRSLLKRHMEVHSNAQPKYSCQVCLQKFVWKSSMMSHFKTHVPKKHKCKLCPLSFHSDVKLTTHLKKHSNPKPHSCTLCPRKFAFKYLLNRHMRRGHGHRNFCRVKTRKAVADHAVPSVQEDTTELGSLLPERDENFSALRDNSAPSSAVGSRLQAVDFQTGDLSQKGKDVDQFSLANSPDNNECINRSGEIGNTAEDCIINFSFLRPDKFYENNPTQTEQIMNINSTPCVRSENTPYFTPELPATDLTQMKELSSHCLELPQNISSNQFDKIERQASVRKPPPAYCHSPHQRSFEVLHSSSPKISMSQSASRARGDNQASMSTPFTSNLKHHGFETQSCKNLSQACTAHGDVFADTSNLQKISKNDIHGAKIATESPTFKLGHGGTPDMSSNEVVCSPGVGGEPCARLHPELLPASSDPCLGSSYSESPCYFLSPDFAHNSVDATHHSGESLCQVECQDHISRRGMHQFCDLSSTSVASETLGDSRGTPTTSQYTQNNTSFLPI